MELGEGILFGMETNPKGRFLGGMEGKSLVISQSRKVGFKKKSKE
jgi:hypothetical protein